MDALNPVQVSESGMDTAASKAEFGRDVSFWGGARTQVTLARGTPADVAEEVRRRIGDLAPGGGFVFASVHNLQAHVPVENILAMWQVLEEVGGHA